ncbi:MAG: hypothetical protein HN509_11620 [Halobacteriovoraceae bacterium]|jgi:hypothetical protein|nr:hypothetical protein [Halobacteriovoraceae bacterium]
MVNDKIDLDADDEDKKPEAILKAHRDRLKYLKKGQEFSQADDIPKAVQCYNQYLHALALFFRTEEPALKPKLFDQESDIAELLLISHVYWDLAKAYDRSPNLRHESVRCLDQFTKFTIGYKYQHVNAQMLRNFIKKRLAYNPKAFKQAYEKIKVQSKSCYIATYCYSEEHPYLANLRQLKLHLLNNRLGNKFVDYYYLYSPLLISWLSGRKKTSFIFKNFLAKPFIYLVIRFIKILKGLHVYPKKINN